MTVGLDLEPVTSMGGLRVMPDRALNLIKLLGGFKLVSRGDDMITGVHTILYSRDVEATRAFFRDALEFPSVDAGGGWLIFALPPAEAAAHPTDGEPRPELYLMCDDLDRTIAELRTRGVETIGAITDERWGRVTALAIPGAGTIGLYEPRHPTALGLAVERATAPKATRSSGP